MLRKLLACIMAVCISGAAFTTTAFFAADSVLVVDPEGAEPLEEPTGSVEVVKIPSELPEPSKVPEETTESSEESSEISSVTPPPVVAPSNASTVVIPSDILKPSSSEQPSSSEPSSSEETSSESSEGGSESADSPSESSSSSSSKESPSSASSSTVPADEEMLIAKISTEPEVGVYPATDLLAQIVSMEMGEPFADEALKAQAVAAHSYIKYQNQHGNAPVVYCRAASSRIKKLVASVKDEICYYGGSPINAPYCASTGGHTESSQDVWGGYLPYLVSVESIYDNLDPNWGYQTVFTVDEVKKMVQDNAGITLTGDPKEWFKVVSHTTGGGNAAMTIGGKSTFVKDGKTYKITGAQVRTNILRMTGRSALKSTQFDVTVSGDKMTFTTYGYGHCVGLSMWGAHYYAVKAGYTYKQILQHYYTGVTIQ